MNDLPIVTILVITYKRYDELKQTLYALQKHIQYPKDKLRVVVSDDSTGGNKLNNLGRIKAFQQFGRDGIHVIETPDRSGWGKHVNFALRQVQDLSGADDPLVFQIEDDYILTKPLDLTRGVALMMQRPNIGMLRYRGTAGAHYIYHQFEADAHEYGHEPITYLQLDNASHSLYVYSNGAHLKRATSFHAHYGAYPENKPLGETEEAFAHMVKDGMKAGNAPAIAILPDWIEMRFDHIGESFQNTEDDI